MKIKTQFLQTGGEVAPAQPQGGEQGGGAQEQLAQMAQQIIQQLGPEAAAMLADMIVQMLQGASQQAPAAQGQPVYKRGGKLGKMTLAYRK